MPALFNTPSTPVHRPRRQALALGAGLLLPVLTRAAPPAQGPDRRPSWRHTAERPLMGTTVRLLAETDDPARAATLPEALGHAFARMAALAGLMTHYQPTSGTGAVTLAAGLQPVPVAPPLLAVLQQAQALSARSGGAFDVTIGAAGLWQFDAPARPLRPLLPAADPALIGWRDLHLDARAGTAYLARRGMRLDLGGIAKLPILQAGLDALAEAGVARALVNGGGDVLAASPPARDAQLPAWRVGVRHPARPDTLLGITTLHRGVVASSGDYERWARLPDGRRWHHVLDPRSGRPTERAHGVTLLGADVAAVNGLGAALMVLDEPAGRALLAATPGAQAVVTRRDGSTWATAGMAARLRPA